MRDERVRVERRNEPQQTPLLLFPTHPASQDVDEEPLQSTEPMTNSDTTVACELAWRSSLEPKFRTPVAITITPTAKPSLVPPRARKAPNPCLCSYQEVSDIHSANKDWNCHLNH